MVAGHSNVDNTSKHSPQKGTKSTKGIALVLTSPQILAAGPHVFLCLLWLTILALSRRSAASSSHTDDSSGRSSHPPVGG